LKILITILNSYNQIVNIQENSPKIKEQLFEESVSLPEELRDIVPMESMLVTSFNKVNDLYEPEQDETIVKNTIAQPILIEKQSTGYYFPKSKSIKVIEFF